MIRERDLDQIVKRDPGPKQETINFRIVITSPFTPNLTYHAKLGRRITLINKGFNPLNSTYHHTPTKIKQKSLLKNKELN